MSMDDLDDMSRSILEAIYHHGGKADTSEIKEYTGYEDNSKIHYRRQEHLEPGGLVETETEDKGGTLTVTVWHLTEKGQRRLDQILGEETTPPLERRVEDLREVVSDLKRQVEAFEGRVDDIEQSNATDAVEEVAENVEGDVSHLEQRVDRLQARQDALLGVLGLYDMVVAEHIDSVPEEVEDADAEAIDVSKAFNLGALPDAAGSTLKAIDELPPGLTTPAEEIEEQMVEDVDSDDAEDR